MKNKGCRKIKAVVFTVMFLVTILFLVNTISISVDATPPVTPEEIFLNFSFNPPEIATSTINGTLYQRLKMDDLPIAVDDGIPLLPVKPVNVLLPQCSELSSIEVISNNFISLGYEYNLELGVNLSDNSSYPPQPQFNTSKIYPPELFSNCGFSDFRGYSILSFTLNPVRYINSTGELFYYDNLNVTIKTNSTGGISPWFRGLAEDEERMKEISGYCNNIKTYDSLPQHNYSPIVKASESYDYVIITDEDLKNSDGDYTFQDLRDYKNSLGTKTKIVTVDDIEDEPEYWWDGEWGDGAPESRFNNTQAKIRNFIKEAYCGWGIKYVLLGGDVDVIPERKFRIIPIFPMFMGGLYVPSDLYYAALDGNFNADGDLKWGELESDGIDLRAEVYIGRACVSNSDELSNFVKKTISYWETTDSYLNKVLMLGEDMTSDILPWLPWPEIYTGQDMMEKLIDGSSYDGYTTVGIPSEKTTTFDFYYDFTRLYDYYDKDWLYTTLIEQINDYTPHIINHGGHSSYYWNLRSGFTNDVIDDLTNDNLFFVYSWGCQAGYFGNKEEGIPWPNDCPAEHFTVKTEHGVFAGIWNAGPGIRTPSFHYHRWFWDSIFGEGYSSDLIWREIGPANQYSKEQNIFRLFWPTDILRIEHLYHRIVYYELTVFGDPQIIIKPSVIPDHDILVGNLYSSDYVLPDTTFEVSSLIFNQGANSESDILVNLTVDGSVEDYTVIDSLVKNGRETLVFDCSLSYGEHQIGIDVQHVPSENVKDNNYWTKTVISDTPPNKPNTPSGPTSGTKLKKYNYTTSTTDPDGGQVYYMWNWGDLTKPKWVGPYDSGENCTQEHQWLMKGTYSVRVKAKDIYGLESDWSNPLPVTMPYNSVVSVSAKSAVVSNSIQFNCNTYGGTEPYSWSWDFGDGNYSYEQNPLHTYYEVGNYTVNLTVTDNDNESFNITEVIAAVILRGDFTDSVSGDSKSSEIINFNDLSDGVYGIVNWTWDFDDGNISYVQNSSHSYYADGTYNVTLTVTDNQSHNYVYYQLINIESSKPEITSVSSSPNIVGYSCPIVVSADVIDNQTGNASGINTVKVNITYPDDSYGNYTMDHKANNTWDYVFNDTWTIGKYDYVIWVVDNSNNSNTSTGFSFNVSHSFGNTNTGDSNQNVENRITGSVFTPYESGIADNITAYIQSDQNLSGISKCMIYRKNDSVLIGTTQEIDPITGTGSQWKVYNFSGFKPVLLKDTEYVLVCWSNISCNLAYSYHFPGLNGRYNSSETYGNASNILEWDYYDFRVYSIYCNYTPDNTSPEITNISDAPDPVGFGFNVTISADVTDDASGVDTVKVNITYPDDNCDNYTMINTGNNTYECVFSDTWLTGGYNYTIWAVDLVNNSNTSSGQSFTVSGQATMFVCTIKDNYEANETINLTDPPNNPEMIGYELLDDGGVLHIWNKYDSYYFDTNSGIQLTNHYDKYWSHNVLKLGYYNNDQWNLIYRNDELSGFNNNIDTDYESYVNATIWKDLTYMGYSFRLAIRYHLGVDDNELTIIPYIKNLGENIPYTLGFGWEMKDIQIDMTPEGDYINVNKTIYYLDQTLNNVYTDLTETEFYLMENITDTITRSLYLKWDPSLNYKLQVKSRDGQYNAPVTLFIKIGPLSAGQEKYTEILWYDADQVTYYFDSYDDSPFGEAWATNPGNMVDGSISNYASTTINGDVELCDSNNCSGSDFGTISKVELRVCSYYTGYLRETILRPVFGGTTDGNDHPYQTPIVSGIWSPWFEITRDNNAPDPWSWIDIQNLDCDIVAENDPMAPSFTLYCSKVEVRVTYIPYSPPEITNPYPPNNGNGIPISPTLNITVSDASGESMNITWFSNSSGSWQVFGTNNSIGNGTYHQIMNNASVNGQWWYWKLNVTDGTNYSESNVFKFYTGYQSKIVNTGSTDIKGYLQVQVQFYNNSPWVVVNNTINETTMRTINASEQLGLDTVFNGLVNTSNLSGFGNGTYRIYAVFRDPEGNVLVCDNENELVATYEFTITCD